MMISNISVKRPVLATVMSLLLVAFGLLAFDRLSLREYPDIDPPVVTITTDYPGASAYIVESRITKMLENRIAGVQGIEYMSSTSKDGRSKITIQFDIDRDIDAAANDVRDRVARVVDSLPEGLEFPDVRRADGDESVIMWLNLNADDMTVPELTDYAERYLVDRFAVLDGVARVRVGGGQSFAMRIWLNPEQLAARGLTANDVVKRLREQNIELPAGTVFSEKTSLNVRVARGLLAPDDFSQLILRDQIRLGDVAKVELGAVERRSLFRGNGLPMVGIGIIKQSNANTLEVAQLARERMVQVNETLPEGIRIAQSYDSSVFISNAINEVYKTLGISVVLVFLIIIAFLKSVRTALVPAVTVPVSVIATFWVLWMMGFSINLLTLLALVLAIGLVVDDAIVVLENIQRHLDKGHKPLSAAYLGARQVGFAVVATTAVLVAVFVPIAFLEGQIGRLFSEFAITMAIAVIFSSWVALTLSPALASNLLKPSRAVAISAPKPVWVKSYQSILISVLRRPWMAVLVLIVSMVSSYLLVKSIPQAYAPKEDRGAFFVIIKGPEGATHDYMRRYADEIEDRLMPLVDNGEAKRVLIRTPRSFGNTEIFNTGLAIVVLEDWEERRSAFEIMGQIRKQLSDLPGVKAFPVMRQSIGGKTQKPVQFVIGGPDYERLAEWRDILMAELRKNNPGFEGLDSDYDATKPQLLIQIDEDRASTLGISTQEIASQLQVYLGSKRATTYVKDGQEYDILLQGDREDFDSPESLSKIYVRSSITEQLVPLNTLVSWQEFADSGSLNRYNRMRAITIEANLVEGYSLGEALDYLNTLARTHLPEEAMIDYKGQSRDLQASSYGLLFIFVLGLVVVYLVLAAQFESFVHPFVILLTVPLATLGGLLGLWMYEQTLNIYTQIGLVMLIGLATKNGVLIVEFANQLRAQGAEFYRALVKASVLRLRPILMTAITTCVGTLPLIFSSGAGSETRYVIGMVLLWGVSMATLFTLVVIPVMYSLLAKRTRSSHYVAHKLEQELLEK